MGCLYLALRMLGAPLDYTQTCRGRNLAKGNSDQQQFHIGTERYHVPDFVELLNSLLQLCPHVSYHTQLAGILSSPCVQ